MRRFALIALACAALLAGCGGAKTVTPTPNTVVGSTPKPTTPTTTIATPKGDPTAGKAVFTSAGCVGCHTLKAANSHGTVGPNLDDAKPALARIFDRVTNGKGAMPSFKGRLSSKQIADVAAFVFQSTHS
ncbi:MAG TPA: cytochrome c [Gaiellaceae bacterium]|nr:cytochrome c [Gaiellaceae bacterium]